MTRPIRSLPSACRTDAGGRQDRVLKYLGTTLFGTALPHLRQFVEPSCLKNKLLTRAFSSCGRWAYPGIQPIIRSTEVRVLGR